MLRGLRPRPLLRPLPQPRLLSTKAEAGATTPVKRTPGSVKLPPPPPTWRMALRLSTIAVELAAMKLRHIRNVPINIRARKMRETFIRLGPAFVKAGQALATRPDAGIPAEVLL
jgi:predicted unusual protein kinase regulating ubiquinone biosynthesis (AarF/ABC1/UbiB family)